MAASSYRPLRARHPLSSDCSTKMGEFRPAAATKLSSASLPANRASREDMGTYATICGSELLKRATEHPSYAAAKNSPARRGACQSGRGKKARRPDVQYRPSVPPIPVCRQPPPVTRLPPLLPAQRTSGSGGSVREHRHRIVQSRTSLLPPVRKPAAARLSAGFRACRAHIAIATPLHVAHTVEPKRMSGKSVIYPASAVSTHYALLRPCVDIRRPACMLPPVRMAS